MPTTVVLKILTAGDGAVGKTTLLNRYVSGRFLEGATMTIGVDILKKVLFLEDYKVMLQLWDFGGQEQFRFLHTSYTMGASGAIVMFDLTRLITLNNVGEWVKICTTHVPDLPMILIGSKMDLQDLISVEDDFINHKFD